MYKFTDAEVQKIEELNNKLILLEERLFDLSKVEYLRTKKMCEETQQNMDEYDFHIILAFSTTEEQDENEEDLEFANWRDHIYFDTFENDDEEPFGINDKYDWNVMIGWSNNKKLDKQKHCWLLHQLYDNYYASWEEILRIDQVWFKIVVEHEYMMKLEEL